MDMVMVGGGGGNIKEQIRVLVTGIFSEAD